MQQNGSPLPPAEPDPAQQAEVRDLTGQTVGQDEDQQGETAWDGTEVEWIADQGAADYEEAFTGLKIRYTLTQDDYYACLKAEHPFKTTGNRAVVQTVLLALFGVLFAVTYFLVSPREVSSLVFSGICFAIIALIWLVPYGSLRSRAKHLANGKTVTAEIFPDEIQIGEGEGAWVIPLDGTSYYEEMEDLLVVSTPERRIAAFPIRSIEPAALPDIQAMLMSGTVPKPKNRRKEQAL